MATGTNGEESHRVGGPAPPIVAIGASAGGVAALRTLLEELPARTGAAYVVVVHLDPGRQSELAAILGARTAMPVVQVQSGLPLVADRVFVIPPGRSLLIADGEVATEPFAEPRGRRAPIDAFFRSVAEKHGDGFGIILTGGGSDGTIGVQAMKEAGGIILVQDPVEAEFPSMPSNAIAAGVADFVLPVRALAARLVELLEAKRSLAEPQPDDDEELVRRILAQVRIRTGHDFARYKRPTVMRRIARRIQITGTTDLAGYARKLRDDPQESEHLFAELLVSVTTFFRDPRVFEALAVSVVPKLFADRGPEDAIRLWTAGCATGEEAYSLAILLAEEASRHESRPQIQIFSSDLDARALAQAREGRYPETIAEDVTPERLKRYFERENSHVRVRREIRDLVLFTSHSVLLDPPFSRIDFVSCRNLLIYLERDLQRQVLETFQYSLRPGGYLLLGTSESADLAQDLFRVVDRDAHLFQATSTGAPKRVVLSLATREQRFADLSPPTWRAASPSIPGIDSTAHLRALEQLAPPSIVVDASFRALHLSPTAGRFLQPAAGPLTADLVDAVRPELRFDLRLALHRAFERGEPTLSPMVGVRFNGSPHKVFFQVLPLPPEASGRVERALVVFLEGEAFDPAPEVEGEASREDAGRTIRQLEEELIATQGLLRAQREESEAVNEELRAANEELQSIAEEYRSTGEELETSREELQSTNEELETVNSELRLQLEEVSRANRDIQNLLATAVFGTLFLDASLRIKRFTPSVRELFSITETDEGRPLSDFTHGLEFPELLELARRVVETGEPIEREIRHRDARWFLVRMGPYRDQDRIDGAVLSFVDISSRRRAELALAESEDRFRRELRLVQMSRSPIFVWDFDGGIVSWNRGGEELYGWSGDEAIGRSKTELLGTQVPGGSFEDVRRALLERGSWSGELRQRTKDGRAVTVESRIELFPLGDRRLVLESARDVTERKEFERRRELLLAELTHRVKNTLAVVQSIARLTLRSSRSREDFVQSLEGRLAALSEAHRLLVDSEWRGTELGELVRAQLAPYSADAGARVHVEGESVLLPPRLATPFALVFHELATNAAKYGALSDARGEIDVAWKTAQRGGETILSLRWKESGGPEVSAPEGAGSGTQLVRRGVPGARVELTYPPEGVECTIEIELEEEPEVDAEA